MFMSCGYTIETKSISICMDCNCLTVTKIFDFFYKENEGGEDWNFLFVVVVSSIMQYIWLNINCIDIPLIIFIVSILLSSLINTLCYDTDLILDHI